MSDQINSPMVSVIVPMYNQRRYIDACLKSISRQTYRNFEVLVVNDGSTDDSPMKARRWAECDNRIKVIDKSNGGVAEARRDGLIRSVGEYVAFVDSDDLLPPRALEILVGSVMESGADLSFGAVSKKLGFVQKRHMDKMLSFPCNQVICQPELFDKYFVGFYKNSVFPASMWGRLYRKSVIDKAMRETELFDKEVSRMGEDQFFNLKLFPYLKSMYRTDKIVYIYRYGGGTNQFNPHFPQLFVSSDKRLKLLDKYQYNDGYASLFAEYVACLYFHASRLISCREEDKQGVISFFEHEVEKRELMPRLEAYYAENSTNDSRVQLLLKHDYVGMYQYAFDLAHQHKGSLKQKAKSLIISLLKRFS